MNSMKRLIQVILVSTSFLILGGCYFSKDKLNQPIQEYLKQTMEYKGSFLLFRQIIIGLEELAIKLM